MANYSDPGHPQGKIIRSDYPEISRAWRLADHSPALPSASKFISTANRPNTRPKNGARHGSRSHQTMRPAMASESGYAHDAGSMAGPPGKIRFGRWWGRWKTTDSIFAVILIQAHRVRKTVCIWIGPEGDFAPEELSAINCRRRTSHHARPACPALRNRRPQHAGHSQLRVECASASVAQTSSSGQCRRLPAGQSPVRGAYHDTIGGFV